MPLTTADRRRPSPRIEPAMGSKVRSDHISAAKRHLSQQTPPKSPSGKLRCGPGDSSHQPVRGSSVVCCARTPWLGRYATLHLEDANRGRPLERKLLFRLRPNSRTVREAALRSYLGSAHGFGDPVQETAVPLVLPPAVSIDGAIGSSRWIGQTRRCRCPRFHRRVWP